MTLLRYFLVLTVIAAVSSGLLAYVNLKTRDPISENSRREKLELLRQVVMPRFPAAVLPDNPDRPSREEKVADAVTGRPKTVSFFEARDSAGALLAVAVRTFSFCGYSGPIDLMFGIAADGVVIDTRVLSHTETPGLGTKLTSEKFAAQFRGIRRQGADIRLRKFGGAVDAISGASVSSHAFTSALNESLILFDKLYPPTPAAPDSAAPLPEEPKS